MVETGLNKPPPSGDHEPAPKPKRFWWRFMLGSLLIVLVSAAATATVILRYIDSIAQALSHNNVLQSKVEKFLAQTHGGEPENILILGSDKRASEPGDPGRSDTTLLLRLDPDRNAIALMSIPRDLKVEIPGVGTDKFNAAFAYGGPKLTLRVVKELTGLPINHVVNVDYLGFVRAVDAINCVYVDVDRRYFHSNLGLPPSEQYSEINIQPGYQLLCGKKALQYVRYRHTDTDLVRAARQQDFLSAARQRVPIGDLVLDRNDLIGIFTEYTTSDINDKETMLDVLKLFVSSRNAAIKEVHFPAELGPSYVYASPEMIHEAVDKFLGIEASSGPRGSLEDSSGESGQKKKGDKKKGKASAKRKQKPRLGPTKPPGSDGLVPAREAGELEAKSVTRKVSSGFPVFYPTRLPSGAFYVESNSYEHVQDPRVYHFKDPDGNRHGAYRMVVEWPQSDGIHYFGLQGIQGWSDPPILASPSLTKTINGREYDIYVDGDRLPIVAWHRGNSSYWVSNDLLNTLTNDQMIGIARSADAMIPHPKRKGGKAKR
ncbi:MAG: polyisoprenyl-teichoic acid--peptidoglycan teichoic acid transferase [Solirubrobacterales bacterium]|nr:polyisoprenyl-teichoic acid--peptidoglycan teichoic acid transferase [Solirubrobacterales bacterium]